MYTRKIEALKIEHAALEQQLLDIAHMTDEEARELKKEKLRIKDLIDAFTRLDVIHEQESQQ